MVLQGDFVFLLLEQKIVALIVKPPRFVIDITIIGFNKFKLIELDVLVPIAGAALAELLLVFRVILDSVDGCGLPQG